MEYSIIFQNIPKHSRIFPLESSRAVLYLQSRMDDYILRTACGSDVPGPHSGIIVVVEPNKVGVPLAPRVESYQSLLRAKILPSVRGKTKSMVCFNPFRNKPHQNVVWCNHSWLGFLKILNYVPKERETFSAKNEPSFVTVKCCDGS